MLYSTHTYAYQDHQLARLRMVTYGAQLGRDAVKTPQLSSGLTGT
jgi:hypothetical protein